MWRGVFILPLLLVATPASAATSAGCAQPALQPGDQTVALTSDGRDRPFLLYVPQGYDGRTPLPLVLNLHPTGGSGAGQMDTAKIRPLADAKGWLVAAPDGGAISGTGHTWVVPNVPPRGTAPEGGFPDDLRYLLDVVTAVQERACQDPARVYATGYSGGGRMTSALACGAAERIAAVVPDVGLRAGAPRTGASGGPEPDSATCVPARPITVIAVHGTADSTNPYNGGGSPDWQYSVPQALARWGEIDGCSTTLMTTPVLPTLDVLEYPGCRGGARVALFRVNGGTHVWFQTGGDGPDNGTVSTDDLLADTVARYALQPPRVVRLRVTCKKGILAIGAMASVDSPLRQMVFSLDGKPRFTTTSSALLRSLRVKKRAHRVRIDLTDAAGLTGSRSVRVAKCQ